MAKAAPGRRTPRSSLQMPRSIPSLKQALRFIETNGVVLESAHGRVPTFVDFVAGERVTGWWSHPLGRSIFPLTRLIRDSPDVLICRVIDHKVTYVHRRVWPALVKLSSRFNKLDLAWIQEKHLPNGKHKVVKVAFPRWVPAEIIEKSRELGKREAEQLLAQALPE
jgi:hypothetical protein